MLKTDKLKFVWDKVFQTKDDACLILNLFIYAVGRWSKKQATEIQSKSYRRQNEKWSSSCSFFPKGSFQKVSAKTYGIFHTRVDPSLVFNLEYPSQFFIKFKDQGQFWNLFVMRISRLRTKLNFPRVSKKLKSSQYQLFLNLNNSAKTLSN